jgi:type II secretory pathway pseudopilin PulG
MIVIAIIGILVAGLYPSLTSYLARWRDATKINEIAQLNTALVLYQVANKTYGVQWTGWMGWGLWWINFVDWIPMWYTKSLFTGLQEKWFINSSLRATVVDNMTNPPTTYNISPCVTASSSQNLYMLYFDDSVGKYSISGYLENPLPAHIANIQLSWNGMWANWTCSLYGRNYAVGIN